MLLPNIYNWKIPNLTRTNWLNIKGYSFMLGYCIYFLLFIIYLELSPKLSNIWIRCDSNNILKICPGGIRTMLYKPFQNLFFWKPEFWDINFYIGGYIFTHIMIILYKISIIII
jgi:hypothetical protein